MKGVEKNNCASACRSVDSTRDLIANQLVPSAGAGRMATASTTPARHLRPQAPATTGGAFEVANDKYSSDGGASIITVWELTGGSVY